MTNREQRFKPKQKKQNGNKLVYFTCCSPESSCSGDLMLSLNSDGLLTTDANNGNMNLFPVHSSQEGSMACTQKHYCE